MRLMTIFFSLCLLALGCTKQDEAKPPKIAKVKKGPSRAPVRTAVVKTSKGVPTSRPASRPTSRPMGKMPAGHPPTGGATSQPAVAGPSGSIAGKIELAKAMTEKVKAGATLFIIVRRDAGEGKKGMMIAAKKIPVTGAAMFPLTYTVTPKDVMMAGTALAGTVRVSARIDQDGDAISKQPGDVTGAAKKVIKVGDKAAHFTLDGAL